MGSLILFTAIVVFVYMTTWFIISLLKKRSDIADVAWGGGFLFLTYALAIKQANLDVKTLIAMTLVTAWGFRLAIHISTRNKGKSEDGRYVEMRKNWKYPKLQAYTNIFLLQGFFMLLVSVPIIMFFFETENLNWYNYIGIAIWIMGFLFESIGDWQLSEFIKKPSNKGKIMQSGLWKYSRHPNYFGEISLWWGFYIFTLFTPYWLFGIIGPITITFLILGVSGIPMLEKRYKGNKQYDNYKSNTSAFFPLPSKK